MSVGHFPKTKKKIVYIDRSNKEPFPEEALNRRNLSQYFLLTINLISSLHTLYKSHKFFSKPKFFMYGKNLSKHNF